VVSREAAGCCLNKVTRVGCPDILTFEQRPEDVFPGEEKNVDHKIQ
jgi:hypothetical protein